MMLQSRPLEGLSRSPRHADDVEGEEEVYEQLVTVTPLVNCRGPPGLCGDLGSKWQCGTWVVGISLLILKSTKYKVQIPSRPHFLLPQTACLSSLQTGEMVIVMAGRTGSCDRRDVQRPCAQTRLVHLPSPLAGSDHTARKLARDILYTRDGRAVFSYGCGIALDRLDASSACLSTPRIPHPRPTYKTQDPSPCQCTQSRCATCPTRRQSSRVVASHDT